MPIKKYYRVSLGIYNFIKMMPDKTTNVYFHEPSRICELSVGIS